MNIVLNFDAKGFDAFKDNVRFCYEENIKTKQCQNIRDIFFNTKINGLKLVFSIEELRDLLSMMQEAALEGIFLVES